MKVASLSRVQKAEIQVFVAEYYPDLECCFGKSEIEILELREAQALILIGYPVSHYAVYPIRRDPQLRGLKRLMWQSRNRVLFFDKKVIEGYYNDL